MATGKATKPSKKEQEMLSDLRADFQIYRMKLKGEIRNTNFKTVLGVLLVIAVGSIGYIDEGIQQTLVDVKEKLEFAAPLFGLPTTFSLVSFNKTKELKKRLKGIFDFEDQVSEMEKGLREFTEKDILALEHQFEIYIR